MKIFVQIIYIFTLIVCFSANANSFKDNPSFARGEKISWCFSGLTESIKANYNALRKILNQRTTIHLPFELLDNDCDIGHSQIWWLAASSLSSDNLVKLKEHVSNGGIFIVEGLNSTQNFQELENSSIGLKWENPSKNGMFYRSFYLLKSLDGCFPDDTQVLMWKKKPRAEAPVGIYINTYFLTMLGQNDCFKSNIDYKVRSFINIILAFMTTDYKEDQRDMPEILERIKNLGLEP